jgi:hypothetical protein
MAMDLTGIINAGEYYTNYYFSTIFEENAKDFIAEQRERASADPKAITPWAALRKCAKDYYLAHDNFQSLNTESQNLALIRDMAQ